MRRASSRAATAARPGRCSARSTASRAATPGTTPRTSRPATSACRRSCRTRTTPARFWAVVQGFGIFETTDDGGSWAPRNKGLRADWPLEDPEVGYCVHKLVMSPPTRERLYQQNHVGMHRSDDAGQSWTEITEGLPTEFGFARRRASRTTATRSTSSRSTPATGAACPRARRRSGARATPARAGSGSTTACRSATRTSACCARAWRSTRTTCPALYFGTSTGQVFASADEGESWSEIASYLPGDRLGRGRGRWTRWPTCTSRRRCRRSSRACRDGSTSRRRRSTRRSTRLDERWPGCATACASRGRRCGATSTSTSTASAPTLDTPLERGLAGRRDRRDQRRLTPAASCAKMAPCHRPPRNPDASARSSRRASRSARSYRSTPLLQRIVETAAAADRRSLRALGVIDPAGRRSSASSLPASTRRPTRRSATCRAAAASSAS